MISGLAQSAGRVDAYDNSHPRATDYRLCVCASGSLIIDI